MGEVRCAGCSRTGAATERDARDRSSGYLVPPGWTYTSGPDTDRTGETGMIGYDIIRRWCPDCRAPADAWTLAMSKHAQRRTAALEAWLDEWTAANPAPAAPWEAPDGH